METFTGPNEIDAFNRDFHPTCFHQPLEMSMFYLLSSLSAYLQAQAKQSLTWLCTVDIPKLDLKKDEGEQLMLPDKPVICSQDMNMATPQLISLFLSCHAYLVQTIGAKKLAVAWQLAEPGA
ncbi:hypothetical protein OPV22_030460 [Ensete ventricosum]|uniref:Uncharacterized protein n=1 Tax=Ensete ventricosum TaxID=4639 RepID=A0AAV8QC39_ENSVE|nr:hypothetical protein OPV22_030460 [Ensete ventricosum]